MKSKMFKRVFAAMLAASSVMAMSGVAMAAKKAPGNGKKNGAPKTYVQSGRKVMKLKKIKARGKAKNASNWKLDIYKNRPVDTLDVPKDVSVFDSRYIGDIDNDEKSGFDDEPERSFAEMMGEEDMLSQDCCNDAFVLKTTNEIRHLKQIHATLSLKNCRKGKEQELVDALISWAKSDSITVKRNIAVAIGDLAQEGFFGDLPQEKKKDVIGALVDCVDCDPSAKSDVAWAFKRLVECGFVNENEPSEAVLKLKAILNDCKASCDVEPQFDSVDDSDSDSCEI